MNSHDTRNRLYLVFTHFGWTSALVCWRLTVLYNYFIIVLYIQHMQTTDIDYGFTKTGRPACRQLVRHNTQHRRCQRCRWQQSQDLTCLVCVCKSQTNIWIAVTKFRQNFLSSKRFFFFFFCLYVANEEHLEWKTRSSRRACNGVATELQIKSSTDDGFIHRFCRQNVRAETSSLQKLN